MNISYKKVSALVFSVIVTTSAFGMEIENITEQSSSTWYKKGSVYAAATAITLAVVGCAYAVRTGKVAVPALLAGLVVTTKTVQESGPKFDVVNNDVNDVSEQKQTVVEQNQDQVTVGTSKVVEPTSVFDKIINKIQDIIVIEDAL